MQGFEHLFNIESIETEAVASTYFGDASDDSSDTGSESYDSETFKEMDPP